MKENGLSKIVLFILGGAVLVLLCVVALLPLLSRMFKVETKSVSPGTVAELQTSVPGEPEEVLVTAIYEMKQDTKKISSIYIEVIHAGSNIVNYVEVPVDTKVTLPEELYKSLQTYGPELPQYFKLSNMAESFSMEYGLTCCNRILSEILGVTIEHYIRTEETARKAWFKAVGKEKTDSGFFADYTDWVSKTTADITLEERWMYYETWKKVTSYTMEQAPGSQEKDGYLLSQKRTKELLGKLMLR